MVVSDAIELYTDFKFIQVTVFLLSQYYICSQENLMALFIYLSTSLQLALYPLATYVCNTYSTVGRSIADLYNPRQHIY